MPTYEYLCLSCGFKFDRFQGIKEEPLKLCPECNETVKRLITGGSGFIMKGNVNNRDFGKPSCGRETTCCGQEYACGKSEDCR